jgi:hypothetical protein
MVSPRSDPGRPPAPVAESWRRIESWLDDHLPGAKATLRPGVSEADLDRYEATIGRPLPDDVRESWFIHDGQGHISEEAYDDLETPIPESLGLFFGLELNPLLDSTDCLSPRSVLAEWRWWKEFIGGDPDEWSDFDEECTSSPPGRSGAGTPIPAGCP